MSADLDAQRARRRANNVAYVERHRDEINARARARDATWAVAAQCQVCAGPCRPESRRCRACFLRRGAGGVREWNKRLSDQAYYRLHHDDIRAKQKAYRQAHREELAARRLEYFTAHRDEIRAKARERSRSRSARARARNLAYQKAWHRRHGELVHLRGVAVRVKSLPPELQPVALLIKQARQIIRGQPRGGAL